MLDKKLNLKRSELDLFKAEYEIVSIERDENRTIAKVKSLGVALDKAIDERNRAAAVVDSIKDAIAAGKEVVRPQDQSSLDTLREGVISHQEELSEYAEVFTPKFMEIDPKILAIKRNLELLQTKIKARQTHSRELYLEEAERTLSAASRQASIQQMELDSYQATAQKFGSHLNLFNSKKSELDELEVLAQSLRTRLVNEQVNDPYETRVELLEKPFVALEPVSPDYIRDSGISLGVALISALLSLFIYNLLNPKQQPELVVNTHPMMRDVSALPYEQIDSQTPGQRLHVEATEQLAYHQNIDLTLEQCEQLIKVANRRTGAALRLLLSGISREELLGLKWQQFKELEGQAVLALDRSRSVGLVDSVVESLQGIAGVQASPDQTILETKPGCPLDENTLDAMLETAAYDAGLDRPERINAEALQATHRIFLLQQGIRLGEIEDYVGPLKPEVIRSYRSYVSPRLEGQRGDIDTVYPALK